ncbi:hypothetical protein AMTR_s00040p00186240 [Amborella trichopoda]|uniref:Uncharacterized protein n=2 Tax=Amborella trichopoda TaxID=13333 RepID=W1PXZ0_AMBTC|nr:hypothetical protein AMTR_s00040p00186240 [Amborella trichopoda]
MDPHYASSWPSRMLSESSHCEAMASKNDCLKSLKCRWCRGEGIDDMCFSSNEAWRLPKQVFTCGVAPLHLIKSEEGLLGQHLMPQSRLLSWFSMAQGWKLPWHHGQTVFPKGGKDWRVF